MNDTITIHRIDDDPLEVLPEICIFTDRSRIEDGQCQRKRFLRYELDDLGYISPGSNEHLVIGGATHEGLDLLLQGGSLEKALEVAAEYFWENIIYPDYILPEQQQILEQDGLHLARAFIYAFHSRYLPQLLDTYEILEVEEEINWLVGTTSDDFGDTKYIIMMSRPDGVLKHKQTEQLWHLSHKTAQDFPSLQIEKFQVDAQRMSESMAIWAKYGQPPQGTLYNYFLKGRHYKDKDLEIDRFTSGLIRPYMNRLTPGGDLSPEMLSFDYEWQELDGHLLKSRRLGKGWEKVSIYNEMDFMTYLQWLEEGLVPRGRDYLKESVIGMVDERFDVDFAKRWQRGISYSEEQWAKKIPWTKVEAFPDHYHDFEFPLNHSECFSFNRRCSYHPICWGRQEVTTLIDQDKLIPRQPNHLIELRKLESNKGEALYD